MAGVKDLKPALEKLDARLDGLEDALHPLLGDLASTATQLPLLDKAKLFSLTAYAIETLLFSSLCLTGTDAKEHAVLTELKRVRQYFAKIKAAEEPDTKERTLSVNKEATARVLKAGLGDNRALGSKLAEKIAEERAKALLNSVDERKRPVGEVAGSAEADGKEERASKKKKKKKHKQKKQR